MDRQTYDRMRLLQADHWWFRGKRRILAGLIGALDLPKPAKVLEVGCGPGGNLPMLGAFGEVVGLEPDEDSRAFADLAPVDVAVQVLDPASAKSLPAAPVVNIPMLPTVVPVFIVKFNCCRELIVPMAWEPKLTYGSAPSKATGGRLMVYTAEPTALCV